MNFEKIENESLQYYHSLSVLKIIVTILSFVVILCGVLYKILRLKNRKNLLNNFHFLTNAPIIKFHVSDRACQMLAK